MAWRARVGAMLAAAVVAGGCTAGDEPGAAIPQAAEDAQAAGGSAQPSPPAASVAPLAPPAIWRPVGELALRYQRILVDLVEPEAFRAVTEPVPLPPPGEEPLATELAAATDMVRGLSAEVGGLVSRPSLRRRLDGLLAPWPSRLEEAREALAAGDPGPAEAVAGEAALRREVLPRVRLLVAADRTARAGFLAIAPLSAAGAEVEEIGAPGLLDAHRTASAATAVATSAARRVAEGDAGRAELEAVLRRAASASEGLAEALAAPAP